MNYDRKNKHVLDNINSALMVFAWFVDEARMRIDCLLFEMCSVNTKFTLNPRGDLNWYKNKGG